VPHARQESERALGHTHETCGQVEKVVDRRRLHWHCLQASTTMDETFPLVPASFGSDPDASLIGTDEVVATGFLAAGAFFVGNEAFLAAGAVFAAFLTF